MLGKSVARGAAWLFAGKFLGQIIGLLGLLVTARLLTPEDFGLVAVGISIMAVASALVDFPASAALIQLKNPTEDDYNTAWTLGALRGAVVMVMTFAAAWPVAHIYNDDRLIPVVIVLGLYPFIDGLRNSYFMLYAREMRFDAEFALQLGMKVASFIGTVIVAAIWQSYWALPVGLTCSGLAAVAITFIMRPVFPKPSLKSFRRIFDFSIWLGAGSVINQIQWQTDPLLLGRLLGTVQLGVYTVGNQFSQRIRDATVLPISRPLFASFSTIQGEGERLKRAFLTAQSVTFTVFLPVGLGIAAIADVAVPFLFGEKWSDAAFIVQFVAPIVALSTLSTPVDALAMSMGRTRTLFFRDCVALLIRMPAVIFGLVYYGLIGLLVARAIAAALIGAINLLLARRLIGIQFARQIGGVLRPMIAGALMVGAVTLLDQNYTALGLQSIGPIVVGQGTLGDLFLLVILSASGALVYGLSLLSLWLVWGRPEGPERKILDMAGGMRRSMIGKLKRA